MYRELQNTSFTSWLTERSVLFSPLQQWPRMGKGQLYTWSLILKGAHYFMTLHFWMPTASKMEEQVSLPNVSIPCHNEQRDKKKRYTVRTKILFMFQFVVLRQINSTKGQWLVLRHQVSKNVTAVKLAWNLIMGHFFAFDLISLTLLFLGLQSDSQCWTTGMVCLQALCRIW